MQKFQLYMYVMVDIHQLCILGDHGLERFYITVSRNNVLTEMHSFQGITYSMAQTRLNVNIKRNVRVIALQISLSQSDISNFNKNRITFIRKLNKRRTSTAWCLFSIKWSNSYHIKNHKLLKSLK